MGYIMKLIKLNKDKWYLYILGVIGAIYFGCIFPVFSYLISRIIFILQNIALADPKTLPGYQDQAHRLAALLFFISFGSLIFTTMRWIIFEYFNEKIGYAAKSTGFRKLIHKNYP